MSGGDLVWAIETTLSSANPHFSGQDKARPILRNAFDSYLYRTADGTYEPWLAESYEESEDGKVVTLNLRDGITYSDGAAFDAASVVKNFDKFLDGEYLSSTQSGLRYVEDVTAVDDDTVQFTLSQADNYFLLFLSLVNSTPLSPDTLDLPQETLEAGGTELAGIGAFTITSYTLQEEITFTRRDDYAWAPESIANGQTAAYLDTVTYRTLSEGSTRTGALEQGQVDIASDIQPLDVSTFEDDPDFTYVRNLVSGTPYSLYLNVSKEPFDDIRVREAFAKGVDIDAIVDSIYQGTYDRAWAPITSVGPFQDTSLVGWLDYDVDEANALLDEAGWTERNSDGIRVKDGETLTVRAVAGSAYVRESRDELNIAISAALKQNVGIDYEYEPVDSGTEVERAAANDYEVFDNSYGLADPVAALDLLYYSSDTSRGTIARGKYDDSTLEALIDTGRFTTDLATRTEAYTELQNYVTEQYYVIPLVDTQDTYAYDSSTVHDVTVDAATGQPFGAYTVWLSED
ncbi:MAG TPA: ABC transporter substrate-binding protein [Cellulomonas sp.]